MPRVRFAVIAVAIAGFSVFACKTHASTINFQFGATLQTGTLAGTAFSGTGSYDNAGETGVGMEYFSLTALDFSVDGDTFNRSEISQGGQVILENGVLQYFTAAYFPSTGPINDFALGFGGPGVIGYSTPPGFNSGTGVYVLQTVVPEPSSLELCGMALLISASLFGQLRGVAPAKRSAILR